MNINPPIRTDVSGIATGSTAADGGPGPSPVKEICEKCRLPLTRRGVQGECLRCAFRLIMDDSEEDLASEPAGGRNLEVTTPSSVQFPRYGHFEVERGFDGQPLELGSGAMATTYRAMDTVLRLSVALKVINHHVANQPAARARFLFISPNQPTTRPSRWG